MEIIAIDNKIIVAVKPRGVLSTDEPGGMPELLRRALGDETAPIYTVHRLDAAVGGLMVYARTRHAASDLGKAIRAGRFHKEYLAVVRGRPDPTVDTLTDWLRRDPARRRTLVADGPGGDAREAKLHYAVIGEAEGLSLVWIELLTGRTHQIRCQFSSRGLPLWGDRKYGLADDAGPIALWSCALAFNHPAGGEALHFSVEPPEEYPWTLLIGEKNDGDQTHDAVLPGT